MKKASPCGFRVWGPKGEAVLELGAGLGFGAVVGIRGLLRLGTKRALFEDPFGYPKGMVFFNRFASLDTQYGSLILFLHG